MTKHTILYIAANPHTSNPLKLAEECAAIQRELKLAPRRDDFHFESRWAVSIDELMRHLNELNPSVIHFSGHVGGSAGIVLQDEQGQPQLVTARALSMMVEAAGHGVRVVLLNACYTEVQADALRAKVDCVVGMAGAIGDDAARSFAIRFYGALGNRRSIGNAVAQGVAALAAKQLPDELLPRCMTRDGIVADVVILSPDSEEPDPGGARVAAPADASLRELYTRVPGWFPAAAFIVGVAFVLLTVILTTIVSHPSPATVTIYRNVTALGAAGFATALTAFIAIRMKFKAGVSLMAGGSLAVFVIVFFWNPASGTVVGGENDDPEASVAILVPDPQAAAIYAATADSPFAVAIGGKAPKLLPHEGVAIGGAQPGPRLLAAYREAFGNREPARWDDALRWGAPTTMQVTYRGAPCQDLRIDPKEKPIWRLELASCPH